MKGFCVCCDEHKTIDPEDGHCWACASGRCGGDHDHEDEDAGSVMDPDPDEIEWERERHEERETEHWLRARDLW